MNTPVVPGDAISAMRWQTLAPVLHDAFAFSSRPPVVALGLARVGDPDATRTVYTTIVVLALLGVALLALAIWVFRRTRPESELLAPLEAMQTRGWRKLDPAAQRRLLDASRPSGAAPLRREASAPAVDSSFATVAPVGSFDDLSDDARGRADVIASADDDDAESDDQAGSGDRDDLGEASDPVLDATDEGRRLLPGTDDTDDLGTDDLGTDDLDTDDLDTDLAPAAGESDRAEPDTVDDTGELPDGGAYGLDFVNVIADPDLDDLDDLDELEDPEVENDELVNDELDELEEVPVARSIDPLLAPRPPSPRRSN